MYAPHHSSIGQDFMTFGNEAIGVHHATHARLATSGHQAIINTVRDTDQGSGLRNTLGSAMISLGTLIAGKTAHMQDRHATNRSAAPKSGFVPTR